MLDLAGATGDIVPGTTSDLVLNWSGEGDLASSIERRI